MSMIRRTSYEDSFAFIAYGLCWKMVPGAGIEPARLFRPRDFKSLVSTNFTTRAKPLFYRVR